DSYHTLLLHLSRRKDETSRFHRLFHRLSNLRSLFRNAGSKAPPDQKTRRNVELENFVRHKM
ncbi:hypothetical protein M514_21430, partial [Trichuris suis]